MKNLWIPGINKATDVVAVDIKPTRMVPTTAKKGGGSYFDDEMQTHEQVAKRLKDETISLLQHLAARPDHVVYVGSAKERSHLRTVFDWWKREGALGHDPNIRIDYGIVEGSIRVGEDRGE